jgi:PAS domain S-box-containing protein
MSAPHPETGKPPLRVLHIEDSEADAELVRELLCEEWPDCEISIVTNRAALEESLRTVRYDLVLSDFSLGSFTGLDALRIVKSRDPLLPFIFLSGTIGEDRAIEAVRAGAQDYVIKDRMKRLVTAIQRALRDGNEKRQREVAERRIREQAELINKAREAIIVTDLEDRITFWNQGAERVSGWLSSEVIGRKPEDVLGVGYHAKIGEARRALSASGEWRGELQLHGKAGNEIIVEVSMTLITDDAGRPKARLSISTDITAKKALEEQFLRVQRIESIGMLASGIAHDLNNVLSPILLAAPMIREQLTDPEQVMMVSAVEKSAERGAGLVRQILSFAHGVSGVPQLSQIKHVLRDTRNVIKETFPKNIVVADAIQNDLWPIMANATQIHQVALNLCVNARDAMPKGGRLFLGAENVVLDENAAKGIEGASAGPWVKLTVEDTGTGIPSAVLAHIWEPFFTTKEAGKGTGLGLSTVRGIVENHKGFLTLSTQVGKGSTFSVYFPAGEQSAAVAQRASAHPFPSRGNGELILVVDDEVHIREVVAKTLANYGYRVLLAKDGTEALTLFSARSDEIVAAITDLSMPNLDGASLANVLLQINPKLKVLVMSGMSIGSRNSLMQRYSGAFIPKPFKADALMAAVNGLLQSTKT